MINEKYTDYANKVLSGEITACLYIKQACQRYLDWLKREDIEFRQDKVERVITFCSKLKHFTGSNNGKPFILSDFQLWIVCNIYGFYWKGSENRVIKNVYLELARKNGKSFFAAALVLYGLIADGENNAECELVANSTKQAKIIFSMCKNLVDGIDPKHKYFKSFRDNIQFQAKKSFLQVLSSDANTNDGWNSSVFIIDEFHSAMNSSMYDVMKSSQGNRDNPLAIVITTAGFNMFSPCYKMRRTNIEVLSGLKQDDTLFCAIYTLDDGDDWSDPNNFIKANPNLDISVKRRYLLDQIQQAKNNTSLEVPTRTKNLNQWIQSSDIWISPTIINSSTQEINLCKFDISQSAYVGVDLASVSDLTAVSLMIPYDDKFYFKTFYYLPQSALENNSNAEMYKEWRRLGYLTITDGNVTDYDYILNDILKANNNVIIAKVCYDSYNATQWAIDATSAGLPLEPFSQSLGNFNRPTKEFERLIKSGKVVIDNNEITRWCFRNVIMKYDHNDNCKPNKGEAQSKIDGAISMIEALGGYLQETHYSNQIFTV